jgi:hypothetical protein
VLILKFFIILGYLRCANVASPAWLTLVVPFEEEDSIWMPAEISVHQIIGITQLHWFVGVTVAVEP